MIKINYVQFDECFLVILYLISTQNTTTLKFHGKKPSLSNGIYQNLDRKRARKKEKRMNITVSTIIIKFKKD